MNTMEFSVALCLSMVLESILKSGFRNGQVGQELTLTPQEMRKKDPFGQDLWIRFRMEVEARSQAHQQPGPNRLQVGELVMNVEGIDRRFRFKIQNTQIVITLVV